MAQTGVGLCSPRIWAAKRPARGAPEAAPADSGGRSVQRSPKARRSASQPAFAPRQNRRTDPFRVRRPFRTPIKGEGPRSAAWRPKRGGLRGEPGEGRLRRKHQATRGSHRKPSTSGRAGQIPRSGISLPEGGGLGGESPKGESPGEFPAELGGREGISRSTGMTERPTQKTRLPRRGKRFQTAASEACGAGVFGGGCGGLWRRG
jgi:hypothetical protein